MENTDLSKIRLLDAGLCSNFSFYNKFLINGIDNVAQVLDDDLMKDLLEHTKKREIRDEMLGFIDMIKFQFQQIPMPTDTLLSEPASVLDTILEENCPINFSRMGFIKDFPYEFRTLYLYARKYKREHPDNENATIADVLRVAVEDRDLKSSLVRRIRMLLDSYDHSYDTNVSLERLKSDLYALIGERDKLDEKIAIVREKIANFERGSQVK